MSGSYAPGTVADLLQIIAVEKVSCPRCEAKPLNACTTLGGKKTKTHVPRWEPLLEAYLVGAHDGIRDLLAPALRARVEMLEVV